jgi:hypothetical protein
MALPSPPLRPHRTLRQAVSSSGAQIDMLRARAGERHRLLYAANRELPETRLSRRYDLLSRSVQRAIRNLWNGSRTYLLRPITGRGLAQASVTERPRELPPANRGAGYG